MSEAECKVKINEDDDEEVNELSAKELEEAKKKEKELQAKYDDIALVVCMIVLMGLTVFCVVFKVMLIDGPVDPNISTFRPLQQMVKSNEMYSGNGYLPCNGYVPCQPYHMSPEHKAERLEDAMPCHDYKGFGEGPEGCW